ncbi:MAG: NUDIX domain-containing protein [Elusimicrobia bacterium]|nr:NUDIX domain-containing protein [Elusimicrobiota bacterium]
MTQRHFVATGYVVKDGRTLLLYHKKLRMWLPPGGHIDEGELPDEAVLREIKEETGLSAVILSPIRESAHKEKGVLFLHQPSHVQLEDIPNHPQHIDLIYFCGVKDGAEALSHEHEGMRWCSASQLEKDSAIRDEVRQTGLEAIAYVQSLAKERTR